MQESILAKVLVNYIQVLIDVFNLFTAILAYISRGIYLLSIVRFSYDPARYALGSKIWFLRHHIGHYRECNECGGWRVTYSLQTPVAVYNPKFGDYEYTYDYTCPKCKEDRENIIIIIPMGLYQWLIDMLQWYLYYNRIQFLESYLKARTLYPRYAVYNIKTNVFFEETANHNHRLVRLAISGIRDSAWRVDNSTYDDFVIKEFDTAVYPADYF